MVEEIIEKYRGVITSIELNKYIFNVQFDKHYTFWNRVEEKCWEPYTFEIFDRYLTKKSIFIDVGAWIGPTLLYGAQLSKKSYGFEPSESYSILASNLKLNSKETWAKNTHIYKNAIGLSNKKIKIGAKVKGVSVDSTLDKENAVEVDQISILDFIIINNLIDEKLFIKIDVEGAEYFFVKKLLQFLKNRDVIIYLSIHPRILYKYYRNRYSYVTSIVYTFFKQYSLFFFIRNYVYSEKLNRKKSWIVLFINSFVLRKNRALLISSRKLK